MKQLLQTIQKSLLAGVLVLAGQAVVAQELKWTPEPGGPAKLEIGSKETRHWIDVNGDGRDDFCNFSGSGNSILNCYFATDTGFSKQDLTIGLRGMSGVLPYQWLDLNADGRVDLCRIVSDNGVTGWVINCYLNNMPETKVFTSVSSLVVPYYWEQNDCDYHGCSPTIIHQGVNKAQDFFFSDVDGDGSSEVCYIHQANPASKSLRCRTFSNGVFSGETPRWTSGVMPEGTFARGFYDFNGDGYKDYCALHGDNLVRCTLTSANGLIDATPVLSHLKTYWYSSSGASFVDINGDGNTDFCAPVDRREGELACVLSNGRGWSLVQTRMFNINHGHQGFRWWVDINGDGAVDYCRIPTTSGKPRDVSQWDQYTGDQFTDLSCRLGQIGLDARTFSQSLMSDSDLKLASINVGSGTGLSFCSSSGSGIQTLCRVTNKVFFSPPVCEPGDSGVCGPDNSTNDPGLYVGLTAAPQANPALMSSLDDGLAAQTRITYLSMSDARVYRRSGGGDGPRQQLIQGTTPLVYESRAWLKQDNIDEKDWQPLTGTARYYYTDMMTDVQNGNRGFRERFMLTEGSNTIDHAMFFQGRGSGLDVSSRLNDPLEIGVAKLRTKFVIQPTAVRVPAANGFSYRQRYLDAVMAQATEPLQDVWMGEGPAPKLTARSRLAKSTEHAASHATDDGAFLLVQRSTNELSDTVSPVGEVLPAGTPVINPRVRYVGKSTSQAIDLNGTTPVALPTTIATTKQNAFGNVWEQVQTTQQTGTSQGTLEWSKTTTSTYADDYTKWNLGRMTGSTVVSTAPTASQQLGLFARSAGNSPNHSTISGSGPTPPPVQPTPLAPGVLSAILQLLLED